MIKRIVAVFLSVVCIAGLCFALVGCGNQKDNFVGEWECDSITSKTLGTLDSQTLSNAGLSVTLTVNDDGSAALNMFGQTTDCTWKDNGAAVMTLTIADAGDVSFVLSGDGKLSGDDGDTTMTFVRTGDAA